MRRPIQGAAACLTLAACANSTTDPTAGLSLAQSSDDHTLHLSRRYDRRGPEPRARQVETSGRLEVPLVTLFNAQDPSVPIGHRDLYQARVEAAGVEDLVTQLTSGVAFGHCTFAPGEAEAAFALLVSQVTGPMVAMR